MKFMNQWKRLVLICMLAWGILFLALFSYFMNSYVEQPKLPSHTYAETRRLTSIQGNIQATVGSHMDTGPISTTAATPKETDQVQIQDSKLNSSQSTTQEAYLNPQALKAEFTSRNKEKRYNLRIVTQNRKNASRMTTDPRQKMSPGHRENVNSRKKSGLLEQVYFPKSKSRSNRLRKGFASLDMLSPRLQNAMRNYVRANKHHVVYRGRRSQPGNSMQLLCELKRHAGVQTLDGREEPFFRLGWDKLLPSVPLEQLYGSGFKTCAVVTSAGSMLHSSLGKEIDSHDAVLRFNAAPTKGYERDVGSKTTIRVINSQILADQKYQFSTSSLYKNVTLVAWDPAPYSVNLREWYVKPDYNLFSPYIKHRSFHPTQPFYILHPKYVWQLWDIIQGNTLETIQPNPPSSGFIGIVLMMALCEEVHVYEYIPSLRQTDLCHYYERYFDAACTVGAYHPLLFEKMLVQLMNTGPENKVKSKGCVTLQGFRAFHCNL